MIIDFLGAPGSGKSSLAPVIAEFLEARGYRTFLEDGSAPTSWRAAVGRAQRFLNLQRCILHTPSKVRNVVQVGRALSQPDFVSHLRQCAHLLHVYGLSSACDQRFDALILDEGFAQAVYSFALLSAAGTNHLALSKAVKTLPRPFVVIKLNLDERTLRRRLAQRGARRRESRLEALLDRDADAIRKTVCLIDRIGLIVRKEGWDVLEHTGSREAESPQGAALQIIKALEARLPAPAETGE